MPVYTEEEYSDMIECYDMANKSAKKAAQIYRERFPDRPRHPVQNTILKLMIRCREPPGHLVPQKWDRGGTGKARTPRNEERILEYKSKHPELGIRKIAKALKVSKTTVARVLQEEDNDEEEEEEDE